MAGTHQHTKLFGDRVRLVRHVWLSVLCFFVPMLVLSYVSRWLTLYANAMGRMDLILSLGSSMPRPPAGMWPILARNLEATLAVLIAATFFPPRVRKLHPGDVVIRAVLVANGALVGILVGMASGLSGISISDLFITGIAPHGVLEMPAVLLTALLAWEVVAHRRTDDSWWVLLRTLLPALRVYVLVVVPLLVGAAYIEYSYTAPLLSAALDVLNH